MKSLKALISLVIVTLLATVALSDNKYRERNGLTPVGKEFKSVTVNPDRLISITGSISLKMVNTIKKLEKLRDGSKEPIDIFINSTGGSLLAGNFFLNSIKAAKHYGHQVNCYVGVMAFSMAFSILNECSKRYTFGHSMLMFHPPRIINRQGSVWLPEPMIIESESLKRQSMEMAEVLIDTMQIDRSLFFKHYYNETVWQASHLQDYVKSGYLTIVDEIKGVDIFQYK